MRPKFNNIDFKTKPGSTTDIKEWEKKNGVTKNIVTPEQISVKPVYSKDDLAGMA